MSNNTMKIDHRMFEKKKLELKKEMMRLQQNMKCIVTSAEDRYTNLQFDNTHQFVVSPDNAVLCKLETEGCYSPLTFFCNILDVKNADLTIFMSTLHREPNQDNHMRKVERLKTFKFYQE